MPPIIAQPIDLCQGRTRGFRVASLPFAVAALSTLAVVMAGSFGCARNAVGDTTPTNASRARLAGLPALPFDLTGATPTFQRLFDGVEAALDETAPPAEVDTEASYRRYVEDDLGPWLATRAESIRAAENRVGSLAEATDEEAAVGHALVAYLNERTAEDVVLLDVPSAARAPERAEAIRAAWRTRLAPLFESAAMHWRRCAEGLALPSPELAQWKRRCDDEAAEVGGAARAEAEHASDLDAPEPTRQSD